MRKKVIPAVNDQKPSVILRVGIAIEQRSQSHLFNLVKTHGPHKMHLFPMSVYGIPEVGRCSLRLEVVEKNKLV